MHVESDRLGAGSGGVSFGDLVRRAVVETRPGARCQRADEGWSLDLWGSLPLEWSGNLALHCFASGLGIVAGDARRVRTRRWAARFQLRASRPGADPAGLDFVRAASHRPTLVGTDAAIEILDFEVSPSPDGPVTVSVRGRDRLGFLAQLLDAFSGVGLYPHQLALRTREETVEDRFWLLGVGGSRPTPAAAAALVRVLERRRAGSRPTTGA